MDVKNFLFSFIGAIIIGIMRMVVINSVEV
jgi:hypothetical protein